MATIPAHFNEPPRRSAAPAVPAGQLQRSLETLFPDILLHGTRSCLLSMTTSLTKVSGEAHDYFSRLSQMLAFERMIRSFVRLTAAVSPFPVEFGNVWGGALLSAPQPPSPWGFPASQAKPLPAMGFFAPFQPQASVRSQARAMPFLPAGFQPPAPRPTPQWPDYGMMMLMPMALLAAAPSIEAMWGLAPAG